MLPKDSHFRFTRLSLASENSASLTVFTDKTMEWFMNFACLRHKIYLFDQRHYALYWMQKTMADLAFETTNDFAS